MQLKLRQKLFFNLLCRLLSAPLYPPLGPHLDLPECVLSDLKSYQGLLSPGSASLEGQGYSGTNVNNVAAMTLLNVATQVLPTSSLNPSPIYMSQCRYYLLQARTLSLSRCHSAGTTYFKPVPYPYLDVTVQVLPTSSPYPIPN